MNTRKESHECQQTLANICSAMIAEVDGFTTPVSRVIEHDYGELEGTGSYVEIDNRRFLVTNEHVAACRSTHSLAHQFAKCSDVYRTLHPFVCVTYPNDIAMCAIDDSVWFRTMHGARAIPINRFADHHSPTEHELLFLCGYSGDTSKFLFNQLNCERLQYLTQEVLMPTDFGDCQYHFAVHYLPDRATTIKDGARGLPRPPGWSGTLVWNTRYRETVQAGGNWMPSLARITGVIWGWPSGEGCLLATRVEHIDLRTLKQAIDTLP